MWLATATNTFWHSLAEAIRFGLPVPEGFVVRPDTTEEQIRSAYDELKIRTRTHFVSVRCSSHAVVNLIGPDQLIHTLRRFWSEAPDSVVLVQSMVPAAWCGRAQWHRKNLRIQANEGMMILDPDTYLFNTATGKCIRKSIQSRQRRMIRHVDGSSRTLERQDQRALLTPEQLKSVANLAEKAKGDITWVLDDQNRGWLISVNKRQP
jgi:hypothetical protein